MTYPADVVIRSGAYVVRQRSRERLARSPQMHATFWPPSLISLAGFLSKPACRSEIMHTSKTSAFFQRAIISLVMTFGGRLLDGRGVRLFLLGFAA